MPGPTNTLLIEGTFEELADELAHYIDEVRRKQNEDGANVQEEITPLLEQGQKDEALRKIVTASAILNAAPEKGTYFPSIACSLPIIPTEKLTCSPEFTAAYNLLIHLIRQSPNIEQFLPKVCQNLSGPITSSPTHSSALALTILTTIFNTLPSDDSTRYHLFLAILR